MRDSWTWTGPFADADEGGRCWHGRHSSGYIAIIWQNEGGRRFLTDDAGTGGSLLPREFDSLAAAKLAVRRFQRAA
jgi:hypothetical protein